MGKLTDDDMTIIEGKRDQLVGKIQDATVIRKIRQKKRLIVGKNAMITAGN